MTAKLWVRWAIAWLRLWWQRRKIGRQIRRAKHKAGELEELLEWEEDSTRRNQGVIIYLHRAIQFKQAEIQALRVKQRQLSSS